MAFEKRPNRGNVFPNRDKKLDKHPDFKASGRDTITLELPSGGSVEVEVAIWKKSSEKVKDYLSVNLKAVGAPATSAPAAPVDPSKPPF